MTVGGLALYAPRIAAGIVSGAPQLGLGAAVAPAAMIGGTLVLGGAGLPAAARAGAGAAASAATLSGGARTAYALGSAAAGEGLAGVGGGVIGVGRAGISAATAGLRATGGRVPDCLAERFRTGERDGWTVTGGSAIGEAGENTGRANHSRAPGWAQQLRREQMLRGADRLSREGEAGGAGLKPNSARG